MSKPYWSGGGSRSGSSYLDDEGDAPTSRLGAYGSGTHTSDKYGTDNYGTDTHGTGNSGTGFYSGGGYRTTDEYRAGGSAEFDEDEDYDGYYGRPDNRWRWIAGLAVAVLLVAVIAIATLMRGDSSTPTAQTETAPPVTSTAPRTVIATVPPSPAPAPPPPVQLSPETVVTITTTPSAAPPPPAAAPVPPPPPAAAPAPAVDPRTVTYSVTGTRQLIDLVSIIYTDEQGLPRTDVNVALPWTKTVVLNPGIDFESVTATSVTGQLNCAITDAAGATLTAQNNNTMIATCTG